MTGRMRSWEDPSFGSLKNACHCENHAACYEGKKTRMSGGKAYHRWLCWDFGPMLELAWDLQIERRLLSSSTIKHKDIAFRIGSNILWMSNFSCTSSHLHKVAPPPSMWNVLCSSIFLCVQVLYALFMFGFPLREPCVIFAWLTIFLSFNLHVFGCSVWSHDPWMVFCQMFHRTLPCDHQCGQLPKESASSDNFCKKICNIFANFRIREDSFCPCVYIPCLRASAPIWNRPACMIKCMRMWIRVLTGHAGSLAHQ